MVSVALLKPYKESTRFVDRPRSLKPEPELVDGNLQWQVEEILDKKIIKRRSYNATYYLVKWFGFAEEEATWEPALSIREDCPDLVAAFEQRMVVPEEAGDVGN